MPIITTPRRDLQRGMRACDHPRLLAWPTGNGATALPQKLDETTYTPLATMEPGAAPVLLGNSIYGYRFGPDEKMVALEFCSVTGADNNTQVWEMGLYAFPNFINRLTPTFTDWLLIGTVNFTMTLGTRTLASQTSDPYSAVQTFSSATIRWADTYAETDNDFVNSTAGFYQVFSMGYGGSNKSGHVMVDCSWATLIAIRLVTKAASSTQEFVGMYTEIN